jgi:hypothetical protein
VMVMTVPGYARGLRVGTSVSGELAYSCKRPSRFAFSAQHDTFTACIHDYKTIETTPEHHSYWKETAFMWQQNISIFVKV